MRNTLLYQTDNGGPDGELGASMRYLSQRFSMPDGMTRGLLTDIGNYVFRSCASLTLLDLSGINIPPILLSSSGYFLHFYGTPETMVIYVSAESIDDYLAHYSWSPYASQIQVKP